MAISALLTRQARAASAAPGTPIWISRYNGPENGWDGVSDVGVTPDGSKVFVTGSTGWWFPHRNYATVAYDTSTGAQLWAAPYDGSIKDDDAPASLGVSPDGSRVFVTGESAGSGSSFDYATLAYDANSGAKLWVARYNGPGNWTDAAYSLGVSTDGSTVFVTGSSIGSTGGWEYGTVAYAAATGRELWIARYSGPGLDSTAADLSVSPDGSKVFVTGETSLNGQTYATVAYSATTGTQLWEAIYSGVGQFNFASRIAVSLDGSALFVTGMGTNRAGNYDYLTVAYETSTGTQLWKSRYNGPKKGNDHPTAIAVSPDMSAVFVTGESPGLGTRADYATVAYDFRSGSSLWVARYNGARNGADVPFALGVSPDGSAVYVTGLVAGLRSHVDSGTVAYQASTGRVLWAARFNGAANGNDESSALAVSPDGSTVFVAGSSAGSTSYNDYATVAYGAI